MKFVKKVDGSFSLDSLFNEHLNKFNLKHDQELTYLDDVKNFLEKKSQLELQYAQSLTKLCNQYLAKEEYQVTNDESTSSIFILDKWKLMLEQCSYLAQKKQASSMSVATHCEYFKRIRDQKQKYNQIAIKNLKQMQATIKESHHQCESAFKSYTLEQFLCDQVDAKTQITNANLEKKLKNRGINCARFKKYYEEMILSKESIQERKKKLDLAKLNYVTANFCQNQQLQYYFSMEIPILLNLQNAQLDAFINESINTLAYKELETSHFIVKQFNETFLNMSGSNSMLQSSELSKLFPMYSETNSDIFYSDNNSCFNNLIQFELEPHDTSFNKNFVFNFEKENIQYLCADYKKWSKKLADLDELLKCMLHQINEKRRALSYSSSDDTQKIGIEVVRDFLIDEQLENQRFLVDEKKMQLIQIESKINALGSFNINLREIEEYDTANKFSNELKTFDSDLYQNLELWDTLMKSIDEMQFSDESYDVEIRRKGSNDFTSSYGSYTSVPFKAYIPPSTDDPPKVDLDPSVVPKYARTIAEFSSDDRICLSHELDRSLIVYDEVSANVFKARDCSGRVGFVFGENIQFYLDDEVFVKAVYPYEGLDEQELTFPLDAMIRLLRKNTSKIKIDGEEWWEGVYEDKVGFFPCIFVQELMPANKNQGDLINLQTPRIR